MPDLQIPGALDPEEAPSVRRERAAGGHRPTTDDRGRYWNLGPYLSRVRAGEVPVPGDVDLGSTGETNKANFLTSNAGVAAEVVVFSTSPQNNTQR